MGAKNSCSCSYCLGCFPCPRLQLPRGAPLGPYLLSPPSPLTGWPAQDSTVSHWRPTWGLHPGHLTSSRPRRWLRMNSHMIALSGEEARSWKVLRRLGLPFLGAFSLSPHHSPNSLPLTPPWGSSTSRIQQLCLYPSTLPTTTVFSFSLSPLFFFFFNMQVAMKNLLMKYLLRSLLWARLITYLCLSLASHILNTHLLSV